MNRPQVPGHEWVETEDGSFTLFSKRFEETCHSTSGAAAETQAHYIQGCDVLNKALKQGAIHILEVGFGLGIGWEETINTLKLKAPQAQIFFVSLEIDSDLVEWVKKNRRLPSEGLTVLIGDARTTLLEFSQKNPQIKFDCIYQDAFSPKKNPDLWTKEWFELLKSVGHEETILSTYSSSTSIRANMIDAGWKIQKGAGFGRKRSTTRAYLRGPSDPQILKECKRN
ncbi:MAG: hypothetical protein JNM93_05105 [Bacteriovoracaceae bacterium]|nr:hypothetical protein [Bacteriovoracaceae bacterium]